MVGSSLGVLEVMFGMEIRVEVPSCIASVLESEALLFKKNKNKKRIRGLPSEVFSHGCSDMSSGLRQSKVARSQKLGHRLLQHDADSSTGAYTNGVPFSAHTVT